jgi:tRNA pseudouridine38-40 synthase
MKTVKLTIEYDGTNYCGFQKQKNHTTIQEQIEKALGALCGEGIKIVSSGRTDSGVHAKGHVVSFQTSSTLACKNILHGLNARLPKDISVQSVVYVPEGFHAQFSATRKTYRYYIWHSPIASPLNDRFSYHYRYPLDIEKMQKAARFFIGKHDFKAMASKSGHKDNTVRTLFNVCVEKKGKSIFITCVGDGFLYNMVRNIVGTLLYVGSGKYSVRDVETILQSRKRELAGPTVPAKGLCLMKVDYA